MHFWWFCQITTHFHASRAIRQDIISAKTRILLAALFKYNAQLGKTTVSYCSKMSLDIDATQDLLLLIQQKLRIVQYRYGSLSKIMGHGPPRGLLL